MVGLSKLMIASVFTGVVIFSISLFFGMDTETLSGILFPQNQEVTLVISVASFLIFGLAMAITSKGTGKTERSMGYYFVQPTIEELLFRFTVLIAFRGIDSMLSLDAYSYWGLLVFTAVVQALIFAPGHGTYWKHFWFSIVWFFLFWWGGIAPAAAGHTGHNVVIKFISEGNEN